MASSSQVKASSSSSRPLPRDLVNARPSPSDYANPTARSRAIQAGVRPSASPHTTPIQSRKVSGPKPLAASRDNNGLADQKLDRIAVVQSTKITSRSKSVISRADDGDRLDRQSRASSRAGNASAAGFYSANKNTGLFRYSGYLLIH